MCDIANIYFIKHVILNNQAIRVRQATWNTRYMVGKDDIEKVTLPIFVSVEFKS